jgi:hypothetical protein
MTDNNQPSEASAPSGTAATSASDAGCDGEGARISFPAADFYACNDPETLTRTTPEEAMEEYLDNVASPGCDMVALIREWSPLTVTAYVPMEVTDQEIKRWADSLTETLWEKWGDEHGDPDGSFGDGFPEDAKAVMLAAVQTIVRGARVWSCTDIGTVTLDAEQVETLMRASRPDWFLP